MNKRVLHIFKDIIQDPKQLYLGSTKDIRNRTEFFKAFDIAFDELPFDPNKDPDNDILSILSKTSLDDYSAILCEHTLFPKTIRFLKKNHPQIKILVRGHNAEFYHRLHYALGALKYASISKALHWFKESVKKYRDDRTCARHADFILSITAWESEHYWPQFAPASKIITAPFYLTDYYLHEITAGITTKKDQCVCLMSTIIGPFLYDALNHFQRIVTKSRPHLDEWEFIATGRIGKKWRRRQKHLKYVGLVESPPALLSASRAICILSNLGFGFKTKILEAIMCGCYVLVPEKLFGRLPEAVKPFCKVVNLRNTASFIRALQEVHDPLPDSNPNEILKAQAFESYASIIL